MRRILMVTVGLLLAGCNNTTSSQWHEVQPTVQSKFERAKAICNGRAGETQVAAGRLWILGMAASSSTFKGCMAEQGFAQN
jgi:hypothetical protein